MTKPLFDAALKQAKRQLARDASRQLKRNAANDGWGEVGAGLSVSYSNNLFEVKHDPEHSTQMFDLEYGTETTSPKGTIRKMYASTDELADRFAVLFDKAVKKI